MKLRMREIKSVCVVGLGYIGLPTSLLFADAGYEVYGFDVKEDVIDRLNTGRLHIAENGLPEMFERVRAEGRLTFHKVPKAADAYLIAVPTPFIKSDSRYKKSDLSYVRSAGEMVAGVIRPGDMVILESTVPPRTTEMLEGIIQDKSGVQDFQIVHCPERVIPGKILEELRKNDRIIGSKDRQAAERAAVIYKKTLKGGEVILTDDITAEVCKLAENTFRDINIAYANELSVICDRLGIDVFELIGMTNRHPRVNIHSPGVGVGGHCIPIDPWFLHEQFEDAATLIAAARFSNEAKTEFVAEKTVQMTPGKTIAVLGLSYKADSDDMRESASIRLCRLLAERGYTIVGCEPSLEKDNYGVIPNLPLDEALEKADFAVITLRHNVFVENREKILKKPHYDCIGL